jgi:hypothetical protein
MTRVILGQGVVSVLLLTVHDHVRPIGGVGATVGGPWLPALLEGSSCPSGEAEVRQGGQAFLMTSWGLEQGGKMSPKAPISFETFPQGSSGMEVVFHASSD